MQNSAILPSKDGSLARKVLDRVPRDAQVGKGRDLQPPERERKSWRAAPSLGTFKTPAHNLPCKRAASTPAHCTPSFLTPPAAVCADRGGQPRHRGLLPHPGRHHRPTHPGARLQRRLAQAGDTPHVGSAVMKAAAAAGISDSLGLLQRH